MELPEIWYIMVFDGEEDDADTFNPVGRGAGVLTRTQNILFPPCKKLYMGPGRAYSFFSSCSIISRWIKLKLGILMFLGARKTMVLFSILYCGPGKGPFFYNFFNS